MFSTCERLAQSFLNGTVIELDRLPFLGEKCSRAPAWPLEGEPVFIIVGNRWQFGRPDESCAPDDPAGLVARIEFSQRMKRRRTIKDIAEILVFQFQQEVVLLGSPSWSDVH